VEYRVESGPPSYGVVSVMSAGRPLVAGIGLLEATGLRTSDASEVRVNAPNRLREVHVSLPRHPARELELWIHAISADGSSTPSPSDLALVVEGDVRTYAIDERTADPVAVPLAGDPTVLTISLARAVAHA